MTKLYDYYDVEYNADGNRAFVEDSNYTVPVDEPDLSKVVQIQPQPTTTLTLILMMVHVCLTTAEITPTITQLEMTPVSAFATRMFPTRLDPTAPIQYSY